LNNFPSYIGEAKVPALVTEGEALVIQAQAVQDCGMEIMDVDFALYHS